MSARAKTIGPWAGIALGTALALLLADPLGVTGGAWLRYMAVTTAGTLLLALAWRHVSKSWRLQGMPRHLVGALLLGLLLRLSLGAVFYRLLPDYGYDAKHHNAGFFYPDAFKRDKDAWAIARTELPLSQGLLNPTKSDQYGGLLVLQSLVYAGVSGKEHRPLLQVGVTAYVSVLSVIYTWGFARRAFSNNAAAISAWVIALYPEAVLLAATPMREPFVATALAMGLFGYDAVRHRETTSGFIGLAGGLALSLIVSPPFSLMMLVALGLALLVESGVSRAWRWTVLGLVLLLGIAAAALSARAWSTIVDTPRASPLDLITWWLTSGAEFQIERLELASGWVEAIFRVTPVWLHPALVVFYGVTQPLLPAAIMDNTSVPLMRGVAVWRALGWFLLLIPLTYGALAALASREGRRQHGIVFLAAFILITTVLVAYRGGGDQWDNPRYRSAFLSIQAVFAAWAWLEARRRGSPWLWRVAWVGSGVTLCLLSWYAGRYYQTPRLSLVPTLGVAAAFVVISFGVWVAGDHRRSRQRRLTTPKHSV